LKKTLEHIATAFQRNVADFSVLNERCHSKIDFFIS